MNQMVNQDMIEWTPNGPANHVFFEMKVTVLVVVMHVAC